MFQGLEKAAMGQCNTQMEVEEYECMPAEECRFSMEVPCSQEDLSKPLPALLGWSRLQAKDVRNGAWALLGIAYCV
eukprot:CAMPEP_0204092240 /NCGR_PEP_ID=MMETSP0360-20130528/189808_1 /ASSEMBLY_ACC=CAM_ASM_000342 /TAXON_ID=268821 /ORGANISM="Scrippsiella Hangoei, Strain SHTV-5" /LENGTH=75 /DNA_ID=CAMNT_0051041511 /DNA_START=547 /DNA_END=774 /DNA_ORIENTATION=-